LVVICDILCYLPEVTKIPPPNNSATASDAFGFFVLITDAMEEKISEKLARHKISEKLCDPGIFYSPGAPLPKAIKVTPAVL
jgi:hypothetical protein